MYIYIYIYVYIYIWYISGSPVGVFLVEYSMRFKNTCIVLYYDIHGFPRVLHVC